EKKITFIPCAPDSCKTPFRWAEAELSAHGRGPGVQRPVLVQSNKISCTWLATPLSWLLALDRWLCVPAFRRVCPISSSNLNMPNKLRRDKRGGTHKVTTRISKPFRKPHSVKEVLSRASPTLTRVADQAERQTWWRQWLAQHLPAELTSH